MESPRISGGLATSLILLLLPPAIFVEVKGEVEGVWGTPDQLSPAGVTGALEQDVDVDQEGNAIAVWTGFSNGTLSVFGSYSSASSNWSAPVLLEDNDLGHVGPPKVSIGDYGIGFAAWTQTDGGNSSAWAAQFRVGHGWGPPVLLEQSDAGGADQISIATTPWGGAVAAWRQANGSVLEAWSSRYNVGIGWEEPTVIYVPPPGFGVYRPLVEVDRIGDALVAWYIGNGSATRVVATRYHVDSGWENATQVSNEGGWPWQVDIAVNQFGESFLVWTQLDDPTWANASGWNIMAARSTFESTWETPFVVAWGGGDAYPKVDVNSEGDALFLWLNQTFGVFARWLWASTGFDDQVMLTNRTSQGVGPEVSVNDEGSAAAAWWHNEVPAATLAYAALFSRAAGWSNATRLGENQTFSAYTDIDLDSSGNATAVWTDFSFAWTRRYHIQQDQTPPALAIQSPLEGAHFNHSWIEVRGMSEPNATVSITGLLSRANETGAFELRITLEPGLNVLVIRVEDARGNARDQTLNVTFDDPIPLLSEALANLERNLVDASARLNQTIQMLEDARTNLSQKDLELGLVAASLENLTIQLMRANQTISLLEGEVDVLSSDLNASMEARMGLEAELSAARSLLTNISLELAQANQTVADLHAENAKLNGELSGTKAAQNNSLQRILDLERQVSELEDVVNQSQTMNGNATTGPPDAMAPQTMLIAGVGIGSAAAICTLLAFQRFQRRGSP